MEHFFKGVDGVLDCVPGYANGRTENPSYEEVYSDSTGHAETVKVSYDPARVSLQTLLKLFFTIIERIAASFERFFTLAQTVLSVPDLVFSLTIFIVLALLCLRISSSALRFI